VWVKLCWEGMPGWLSGKLFLLLILWGGLAGLNGGERSASAAGGVGPSVAAVGMGGSSE
jgi:hypothetical protein